MTNVTFKGCRGWSVEHICVSQGMSFAYFPSVSDEEAISVIHR